MKTHDAELERIRELLRQNPKGMKITRIAHDLAMNRNAAAKFLEILLMTGQVEMLEHGMSKIFRLSSRTGIPTMLDLSDDFILVLDKEIRIARINDHLLKFGALKREEVVGKAVASVNLPLLNEPPVLKMIQEAHFGADIKTEMRVIYRDEELFFNIRLTPTVFNDGTPGITIIMENITEQKKNERSLRESEANFRALFGESPAGTAVFDPSGNLLNANPQFMRTFGVKNLHEIHSLNLFLLPGIPPDSPAVLKKNKTMKFVSVINRHRIQGVSLTDDKPVKTAFEFHVGLIDLKNLGLHQGYIVQVNEYAPDENTRLLEEILSCIDEAVILVDCRTSRISFANPAAGKIFGNEVPDFPGRDLSEFFVSPGMPLHKSSRPEDVFGTPEYGEVESVLKRKNGENFSCRLHLRPVYDDSGELRNFVMIIRDYGGIGAEEKQPYPVRVPGVTTPVSRVRVTGSFNRTSNVI